MNFLNTFQKLCERKDVAPSRALEDAGLSKSLYSKWKKQPDTVPNGETLDKLSKYFLVSIDVLRGNPHAPTIKGLEGMPEIEEIVRAAPKLDRQARDSILAYAKFIRPEAFKDGE